MKLRFSEAQILDFLREAAAGTPVMDLCWNHCFSRSTFRVWKAKYGHAIHTESDRGNSRRRMEVPTLRRADQSAAEL